MVGRPAAERSRVVYPTSKPVIGEEDLGPRL
jgi:hypothetical protein